MQHPLSFDVLHFFSQTSYLHVHQSSYLRLSYINRDCLLKPSDRIYFDFPPNVSLSPPSQTSLESSIPSSQGQSPPWVHCNQVLEKGSGS